MKKMEGDNPIFIWHNISGIEKLLFGFNQAMDTFEGFDIARFVLMSVQNLGYQI